MTLSGKPLLFNNNSDYATLMNDSDTATISISIPTTTVPAGNSVTFTNSVNVGSAGAITDYTITALVGPLQIENTVSSTPLILLQSSSGLSFVAMVYRSSPTQATLFVGFSNPTGSPVTIPLYSPQTFTASIRTFLPPI